MTKSLVPGHTWVLVRNPRFRPWSRKPSRAAIQTGSSCGTT